MVVNFKAGRTYIMRATIPQSYFDSWLAQAWIQTESGKHVSPTATLPVSPSSTPVFIPTPIIR